MDGMEGTEDDDVEWDGDVGGWDNICTIFVCSLISLVVCCEFVSCDWGGCLVFSFFGEGCFWGFSRCLLSSVSVDVISKVRILNKMIYNYCLK